MQVSKNPTIIPSGMLNTRTGKTREIYGFTKTYDAPTSGWLKVVYSERESTRGDLIKVWRKQLEDAGIKHKYLVGGKVDADVWSMDQKVKEIEDWLGCQVKKDMILLGVCGELEMSRRVRKAETVLEPAT